VNAAFTPAPFALLPSTLYSLFLPVPFSGAVFPTLQPAVQRAGGLPVGRTWLQPKHGQCCGYFCIFFKPGQLVSALAERLEKVLLIP